MKKCQHCGKDCLKRVAVKSRGKVLMVGSSCSKKFKRARTRDLLKDAALSDVIAKRQASHGGDPSRYALLEKDFDKRFPSSKLLFSPWVPLEFYNWNGIAVVLYKNDQDELALTTKDVYKGNFKGFQQGFIIYEDVSKAKTPGAKVSVAPGYEYNVIGIKDPPLDIEDPNSGKILEWVDEFTSWDPIKKYNLTLKFDAVPLTSYYSYKRNIQTLSSGSTTIFNNKKIKFDFEDIKKSKFINCEIQAKSTDINDSEFDNCEFMNLENTVIRTRYIESDDITYDEYIIDFPIKNSTIFKCNKSKIQDVYILNLNIEKQNSFFTKSIIDHSVINGINVKSCIWSGSSIIDCFFAGENIFSKVTFDHSNMININKGVPQPSIQKIIDKYGYPKIDFISCIFAGCDFDGCDLSNVSFINCVFKSCTFKDCDIGLGSKKTIIKGCHLEFTSITPRYWNIDPLTGEVS